MASDTEADTCRKLVIPRLQAAGWDDAPCAPALATMMARIDPAAGTARTGQLANQWRGAASRVAISSFADFAELQSQDPRFLAPSSTWESEMRTTLIATAALGMLALSSQVSNAQNPATGAATGAAAGAAAGAATGGAAGAAVGAGVGAATGAAVGATGGTTTTRDRVIVEERSPSVTERRCVESTTSSVCEETRR